VAAASIAAEAEALAVAEAEDVAAIVAAVAEEAAGSAGTKDQFLRGDAVPLRLSALPLKDL
jgi:hypothetical protein